MMRMWGRVVGSIGLAGIVAGCSMTAAERADLAEVVQREGVPFSATEIPDEVIDRLSAHRLVIVGETHLIREHHAFMSALVQDLHQGGFRQLLLEWPHMADWLVDEYVAGDDADLDWEPPGWFFYDLIQAVRDFNTTLPPTARVRVRGIDVNLADYGGARDFRWS